MGDKYEILTGPKHTMTVQVPSRAEHTVHRIKALRGLTGISSGELGGWIESDKNLSQSGNCWIADEAVVFADARVMDDAWVGDRAFVYDGATVRDNAAVTKNAIVHDRAVIRDKAWISDAAEVYGDAKISESGQLFGEAKVFGHAELRGTAEAYDNAIIRGTAILEGTAIACNDAIIDGTARIYVGKVTGHVSAVIGETFKEPKKIPEPVISPDRLLAPAEEADPWLYTIEQLKLMCKKQHKSTEGNKHDLMLRLFPNKGGTPPYAPRPGMFWSRKWHSWMPL